jgi:hypothetical protein
MFDIWFAGGLCCVWFGIVIVSLGIWASFFQRIKDKEENPNGKDGDRY